MCITLVMLWLIERPHSFAGKVLNHRAVVHIGILSYSFYIWQQLFSPLGLPWSVVPTMLMAEVSYRFIEQPFLRLRDRISQAGESGSRPPLVTSALPGLQEYPDGIMRA
jgi:peptidoglycan/LPS O-acetylase OafA/YrhL